MTGYLWRLYWLAADVVNFFTDNLFPVTFIVSAVGAGFCLGYLYRFLFGEPGNKELFVMRKPRDAEGEMEMAGTMKGEWQ